MLKDNLIMLRNLHGYSQEEIAGKIGISRQAYAKWERGATVPDIVKCGALAQVYGVSIDSLLKTEKADGIGMIPPAQPGKHIWGSVLVGDRGQIVIPKEARDKFHITGGTRLIVLGDENEGIALIPSDLFEEHMKMVMEAAFARSECDE
ncbi:MAG: helix-turn-helix domain-containing protein [Candidatus Faecousia sp.]|nr:helix-turn-helix domain-containing protein [Candidatus Faecousia sp.]